MPNKMSPSVDVESTTLLTQMQVKVLQFILLFELDSERSRAEKAATATAYHYLSGDESVNAVITAKSQVAMTDTGTAIEC